MIESKLERTVTKLYSLSGREILNGILESERPGELIKSLPHADFLWLLKKIGDDDCLYLLELASANQWQYLLDLEIWRKDRLDLDQIFHWLVQLQQAAAGRLAGWLFQNGRDILLYCLINNVDVLIKQEDEEFEVSEQFFTFDGVFYVRVRNEVYRRTIKTLLQRMAQEDIARCQALLLDLAGVQPNELEEEMYRLRNVRLAEHGFLPFEEAIAVYSPLKAEDIGADPAAGGLAWAPSDENRTLMPFAPFLHARRENLLDAVVNRIEDPDLMDRLRMEFAGLCNQIFSAAGAPVSELETLIKTARQAGGYMNLALEKVGRGDLARAEMLLREQTLLNLFRVGFGVALSLKWDTQKWLRKSWFYRNSLQLPFWAERRGAVLSGVLEDKPRFFTRSEEKEDYRFFERLAEVEKTRADIDRVAAIDRLLEKLGRVCPFSEEMLEDPEITFYPFLFNFWARRVLHRKLSFGRLPLRQAKNLFERLRSGESSIPYRMAGFEKKFVGNMLAQAADLAPAEKSTLQAALKELWREFRDEYAWVATDALDSRFSRILWLQSP